MNINQIVAYGLYLVIAGICGYVAKEWKAHSKELLELKQKEEERAEKLLGEHDYNSAKQIVVDNVYKVEQLAKEVVGEKWNSLDKHSKAVEFISQELNKAGLNLSDEDVYNIIKTTVGYINANKGNIIAQIK